MRKHPPGLRCAAAEAGDLLLLGAEVSDRVEHQVDERGVSTYLDIGHVANCDLNAFGTVLLLEFRQHCFGEVDSDDNRSRSGQRQRKSSGSHTELDGYTGAREPGKNLHSGDDGLGAVPGCHRLVVVRRNRRVEVLVGPGEIVRGCHRRRSSHGALIRAAEFPGSGVRTSAGTSPTCARLVVCFGPAYNDMFASVSVSLPFSARMSTIRSVSPIRQRQSPRASNARRSGAPDGRPNAHASSVVAPLRNAVLFAHRMETMDKTIGITVWLCPCGRSRRLPASWE
jgi:hypothetical protein